MRQTENENKKILVPNSVHNRLGQENSERNSKKNKKKPLSSIIFSENGMRQAENDKKKILSRIPFILDPGKKIPKKIAKKIQKIK